MTYFEYSTLDISTDTHGVCTLDDTLTYSFFRYTQFQELIDSGDIQGDQGGAPQGRAAEKAAKRAGSGAGAGGSGDRKRGDSGASDGASDGRTEKEGGKAGGEAGGKASVNFREVVLPRMYTIIVDCILAAKESLVVGAMKDEASGSERKSFELFGYDFMLDEDYTAYVFVCVV